MTTETSLQIRFNDIDLAEHVHNGVYLNYFEQGRLDYFNKLAGKEWDWKTKSLILARNEIDYIKPVRLHDKIYVRTTCDHVGTKSFSLSYEIFAKDGKKEILHTKGRSIMVCIDYTTNETVDVYPEWKDKLKS